MAENEIKRISSKSFYGIILIVIIIANFTLFSAQKFSSLLTTNLCYYVTAISATKIAQITFYFPIILSQDHGLSLKTEKYNLGLSLDQQILPW